MTSDPTLSPERWERVQDLFHRALDLPEADQSAFVESESGGEDWLRSAVLSLLAADTTRGAVARLDHEPTPENNHPATIGPYRLHRSLGEGGMGVVYLAEREGEGFSQTVALKLLRTGIDSPLLEERLREERRILARLEHPGIARLIDGGATEDGRPYFAMEFVEGEDLFDHCDRRRLSIENRLRVFLEICAPVDYAHRQLIVHRDIKPTNILVTHEGRPRLLDFGVAKLLDTTHTGENHHTGQWLTPAYASPEQVKGDRLSTLADEYALGVLLYQLICGRRPYTMDMRDGDSITHAICEVIPERPSVAATRRAVGDENDDELNRNADQRHATVSELSNQLFGDLDAITLRALAKDPADRYQSVQALAEDITRHLEGFPVRARPSTAAYRGSRFFLRHRTAVVAVCLGIFSLMGGVAATLWQARRATAQARLATEQRTVAQEQATKAGLITNLMVDLFQLSDPTTMLGDTVTAREILDRGTARIERDFGGQPDIQSAVFSEVARIYSNLGLLDRSEQLVRRALRLTEQMFGASSPEVSELLAQLATVMTSLGRREEAVTYLRQTVRIRETTMPPPDSLLAQSKADLGWLLRELKEYDEAARLFSEALEDQRMMFGEDRLDVASTVMGLAATHHDRGRVDEAEELFDRALARFDTVGGQPHPQAASALMNIGLIRRLREQYKLAEPLSRRGLQMTRALFDPSHPELLAAVTQYSSLLLDLGRYREAADLLEDALERSTQAIGPLSTRTASIRNALASVTNELGEYQRSAAQFDSVITSQRKESMGDHPRIVITLTRAANPRINMGNLAGAEDRLREALEMGLRVSGEQSVYRALALAGMARVQFARGDVIRARELIEQARALASELLPRSSHRYILYVDRVRAKILIQREEFEEAISIMESARVILEQRFDRHSHTGRTLQTMAEAHLKLGNRERAEQLLIEALTHFGELPPGSRTLVETHLLLAEARRR